jgi:glycosyltransferase involved in cell wall biosynthesis
MSSQKDNPELTVILPVFNEEKNIPLVVKKYEEISKNIDLELIFVEDTGKKSKTREAIMKEKEKNDFIKPVFTDESGYGISIFNGLKKARGDYVCWTHSDLQTDPADTLEALKRIKEQANPRKTYLKGKRYGRPILDSFFTLGMSIIETVYLGKFLYDINAQPNLFHKSFIKLMKDPPKDFSFDLYAYHLARKENYKIIRFPVFFGKRIHGESAWNDGMKARFKFIKRTLKFTFKLKKRLIK